jgi:acyl-CoA thioester hydrolase
MSAHIHRVQIYYEDTDHSGAVYHANYLKYFERAREHLLGTDKLVKLLNEDGIGFVVYKAGLTYRRSVGFGETIEIHTTVTKSSDYRLDFQQNVHRPGEEEILVEGQVELVCVDREGQLVVLPPAVASLL